MVDICIKIVIGLLALIHLYILWFEMFAWKKKGPKVFSQMPKKLFAETEVMAANQGLYNGFLAAGLIWTFFIQDAFWAERIALFFMACIFVAGVYGSLTVDRKTLFVQSVPAAIGILLLVVKNM